MENKDMIVNVEDLNGYLIYDLQESCILEENPLEKIKATLQTDKDMTITDIYKFLYDFGFWILNKEEIGSQFKDEDVVCYDEVEDFIITDDELMESIKKNRI